MRKTLALFLSACLLFSCAQANVLRDILDLFQRDTVSIGGADYSGGFYGDLYPHFSASGDAFAHNGKYFYAVEHPRFDLICRSQTGLDSLLCAQSQWQEAASYYSDDANFVYRCQIGAQYTDRDSVIVQLDGMDPSMFDRLMSFASENEYQPFGKDRSDSLLRLPEPDRDQSPQLIFYKESRDGLFTSYKGSKFHIIDGKLLMVYYHDSNFGAMDELTAVEVPDEIERYFITLLKDAAI